MNPMDEKMTIQPKICYLIAASPRSGSQLLGGLLTATGLAGFPDEHFNPWHMGDTDGSFPDKLLYGPERVQHMIEKHTSPNGVFGTKAHFLQVTNFVGLHRLESLYPVPLRYISLTRRDVERQGISLARASQTGSFNSDMPATREPAYNYHQIWQCLREVRVQAKGWETYFHSREIEPHRVVYEDLVENPETVLRGVLEFIGVAVPDEFRVPEIRLKKQADSLNDIWLEKFMRGDLE